MTTLVEKRGRQFGTAEALSQIHDQLSNALDRARKDAAHWNRLAMWLPLAGGVGSAFAGAGVAIDELPDWLRNFMVAAAFLGAAAAAASAALKASERAREADERQWQLRSVTHWVNLIEMNLDPGADEQSRDAEIMRRVVLVLARLDQIHGVNCSWSGVAPWDLPESNADPSVAGYGETVG